MFFRIFTPSIAKVTLIALGGVLMLSWGMNAAWGASALDTIIAECRERTGFSEATCTTLVKKYMNVERCQEYTNYSAAECTEKIEEIKNDPKYAGVAKPPAQTAPTQVTPDFLAPARSTSGQGSDDLAELRSEKERDLLSLWSQTQVVTAYVKRRGADTQKIEAAFPEFEARAERLLSAYDRYRSVYVGTEKDSQSTRVSVRAEARENVRTTARDLVDFYRANIFMPLRAAYEVSI